MRVTWSPLAIRRLTEAAQFIALDKPEAAARWTESVFDATAKLADHPRSGRVVPELGRPAVRELIHGSYRIIYRLEADRVAVLTVRHGSRRFDRSEVG